MDVAVVTSKDRVHFNEDDRLLVEALRARGLDARAVPWCGEPVDWAGVGVAVIRSTWDYSERRDVFVAWARAVAQACDLVNPAAVVADNTDKRYLVRLAREGLPVVPTVVVPAGGMRSLDDILAAPGWDEVVIKPVVSAGGRDTYRVRAGDALAASRWRELVARRAMLVQPMMRRVLDEGEVSLIYLGGRFTHAVRKRPRHGEYRVQDDHGGTVEACTPARDERRVADAIVAAAAADLDYARVDLVRDEAGHPRLVELELVEPELFLRFDAGALEALADRITRRVPRGRRG